MELYNILSSRVSRLFFARAESGSLYLPDAISAIQKKFNFVHAPNVLEQIDGLKGAKFVHGIFGKITIDVLEVFNDGIVVHMKTKTAEGDKFIDSLLDFSSKEFSFEIKDMPHRKRAYYSEIEVRLEKSFSKAFERFSGAYNLINKALANCADEIPSTEATGLLLSYDIERSPHLKTAGVLLERRKGITFDSNIFYSVAPLPTDVHLSVLQEIENAL